MQIYFIKKKKREKKKKAKLGISGSDIYRWLLIKFYLLQVLLTLEIGKSNQNLKWYVDNNLNIFKIAKKFQE